MIEWEECLDSEDLIKEILLNSARYEALQFINLHDKNGKELYKGDVVLADRNSLASDDYKTQLQKAEVKYGIENFEDGCCAYMPAIGFYLDSHNPSSLTKTSCHHLDPETEYEVIGNIYENPNLLPVAQKNQGE